MSSVKGLMRVSRACSGAAARAWRGKTVADAVASLQDRHGGPLAEGLGSLMDSIEDHAHLREHFGTIHPLALRKVSDRLDAHCRRFIALSPFLVLATSDASGRVDASPRGDAPGFVQVRDDRTLILPDRPGNNRVDSYGNVLDTGHVGLLFMVPGLSETVRVNGRARLILDAEILGACAVNGRLPPAALLIMVEEAFFHCGKAMMRSHLWDPTRVLPRGSFPGIGRTISEQLNEGDPAELERSVEEESLRTLY